MTTPHHIFNPEALAPPVGYSHAVSAGPGRTIYLGGQTGHGADGMLVSDDLVEQFEKAASNLVVALKAAGARPDHLVSIQIFVTDAGEYTDVLSELSRAYREHLGKHYPAVSLFEVSRLFDPEAKVELVGVAVVPE